MLIMNPFEFIVNRYNNNDSNNKNNNNNNYYYHHHYYMCVRFSIKVIIIIVLSPWSLLHTCTFFFSLTHIAYH